jgi:hypothetical protein
LNDSSLLLQLILPHQPSALFRSLPSLARTLERLHRKQARLNRRNRKSKSRTNKRKKGRNTRTNWPTFWNRSPWLNRDDSEHHDLNVWRQNHFDLSSPDKYQQPLFWGWGSGSGSADNRRTPAPPAPTGGSSSALVTMLRRLFRLVSAERVLQLINRIYPAERAKNSAFVGRLVELQANAKSTSASMDGNHWSQSAYPTSSEQQNLWPHHSDSSQTMVASGRKPRLNLKYYLTNLNLYNLNARQRRAVSSWKQKQSSLYDYTMLFIDLLPVILALRQLFTDPNSFKLPPDSFLAAPFDPSFFGAINANPNGQPDDCYYSPFLCNPNQPTVFYAPAQAETTTAATPFTSQSSPATSPSTMATPVAQPAKPIVVRQTNAIDSESSAANSYTGYYASNPAYSYSYGDGSASNVNGGVYDSAAALSAPNYNAGSAVDSSIGLSDAAIAPSSVYANPGNVRMKRNLFPVIKRPKGNRSARSQLQMNQLQVVASKKSKNGRLTVKGDFDRCRCRPHKGRSRCRCFHSSYPSRFKRDD